jgi:hypothetical protein
MTRNKERRRRSSFLSQGKKLLQLITTDHVTSNNSTPVMSDETTQTMKGSADTSVEQLDDQTYHKQFDQQDYINLKLVESSFMTVASWYPISLF